MYIIAQDSQAHRGFTEVAREMQLNQWQGCSSGGCNLVVASNCEADDMMFATAQVVQRSDLQLLVVAMLETVCCNAHLSRKRRWDHLNVEWQTELVMHTSTILASAAHHGRSIFHYSPLETVCIAVGPWQGSIPLRQRHQHWHS
jgi:hypothetical protein